MIDAARRFSSALETTPYAARLGLSCGDMTSDAATASVSYVPALANAQGFVHGGVAASLSVWTAMLVAVASDRDRAASARPVSVSINYLAAAREEALYATARVSARGRDLVHVEVEVVSDRGRPVAAALAVLRTLADAPVAIVPPPARADANQSGAQRSQEAERGNAERPDAERSTTERPASERPLISPFSQSMGIEVRSLNAAAAVMAMRRDVNAGLGSAIDPGALVALADTCAALACLPSLDERMLGSATLSLSAVFGDPLRRSALATGRQVAEDGGVRSALVEVSGDAGAGGLPPSGRPSRHAAMTACVAYRFVAAESFR